MFDPYLPTAAFLAYLDPGSGSWLFQMIVAGVASCFVFIKYQGSRVAGWFGKGKGDT